MLLKSENDCFIKKKTPTKHKKQKQTKRNKTKTKKHPLPPPKKTTIQKSYEIAIAFCRYIIQL